MSRYYDLKIVIPEDPSLWIYQSYLEKIDPQLNETLYQSLHVYEELVDRTWSHAITNLRMMIRYLERSIAENDDTINTDAVYEEIYNLLSLLEQHFKAFEEDDLEKMREVAVKCSQLKGFVKVYRVESNQADHLFENKEIRFDVVSGFSEVSAQFEKHVTQAGNVLMYLKEIVENLLSFKYLRTTLEMSNDKATLISEYMKSMNQLETHSLTATNSLKAIREHSLIGVIESSATYMYKDDASQLLHDYRRYADQKRSTFHKKVNPQLLSDYEQALRDVTSDQQTIQKLVEQLQYVMKYSSLNDDQSYKNTLSVLSDQVSKSTLYMNWLASQSCYVQAITSLDFIVYYNITKNDVSIKIVCQPMCSANNTQYGSLNGIPVREHPEFIYQKNRLRQHHSDLDEKELDQLALERIIEENGMLSLSYFEPIDAFEFHFKND